jgi:DNA-binding transcriptional ArsR family regulator
MVQYARQLDRTFAALSDPIRRDILQRLAREGSATITELAEPFGISLTGCKKHVQILENVGLIETEKVGRARSCRIGARGPEDAEHWIETYRHELNARLDHRGERARAVGDSAPG